jgi:hypothetical protein
MSAANTENPGSPYEVEDIRADSPPLSIPPHFDDIPVHIGGEPLSPTSATQLLERVGPNVSGETMHFIMTGLAATLEKREREHAMETELYKRQMADLCEENWICMDITQETPKGYDDILNHALGFVIPLGDNEYTAARYIQRWPHRCIAGYPLYYSPGEELHVADIFATPHDNDNAGTSEPLSLWFRAILAGHGAQFQALVQASQKLDDWGVEANI